MILTYGIKAKEITIEVDDSLITYYKDMTRKAPINTHEWEVYKELIINSAERAVINHMDSVIEDISFQIMSKIQQNIRK